MFKRGLILTSLLIIIFALAIWTPGAEAQPQRQVVVLLLDKITYVDIAKWNPPTIKKLILKGSPALMSNHTAYALTKTARSYLTIASGNRALAPPASGLAIESNESFDDELGRVLFTRQTGEPAGNSEAFFLRIRQIAAANEKVGFRIIPGQIGDILHRHGLKTAVLGNADLDTKLSYQRQAALLAMDSSGRIDYSLISRKVLKESPNRPFGLTTNYQKILEKFAAIKNKASLVVIETGDTRRANEFQDLALTKVAEKYRRLALLEADSFLNKLLNQVDLKRTLIIIVTPSPPMNEDFRVIQQLTPLVLFGPGYSSGTLVSESTKRPGIVTSVDIAPTVFKFLSLPSPYYLSGRPLERVKKQVSLNTLTRLNSKFILVDGLRKTLIISYVIIEILALSLALISLFFESWRKRPARNVILGLLLFSLALPIGILAVSIFNYSLTSALAYVLSLIFISVLVVALAQLLFRNLYTALLFIVLINIGVLVVNLLGGGQLNLTSIFGYSPIVAGRFYGIGNQSMSLLLASLLLAAALWLESRSKSGKLSSNNRAESFLVGGVFLTAIFLIGFPSLGANTGGTITAVVSCSVAYAYLFNLKLGGKKFILVILIALLATMTFILVDAYLLPGSSHMGRFWQQVAKGGGSQLKLVIQRKLAANLRIMRYTSWSYLLFTIMVSLILLRFAPAEKVKMQIFSRYPYVASSTIGGLVGSLAGALVNDSGISIPALMLGYFLLVILALAMEAGK